MQDWAGRATEAEIICRKLFIHISNKSASDKLKNVSMESSKLLCLNGISFVHYNGSRQGADQVLVWVCLTGNGEGVGPHFMRGIQYKGISTHSSL